MEGFYQLQRWGFAPGKGQIELNRLSQHFVTSHNSIWNLYSNVFIGGVEILLSPCALKSLNDKKKIQPRMVVAACNGNPCTTIISCYSPINASDETDLINFYNELSSLVRSIPKHNVLIIAEYTNVQICKDENNKFCLHNSLNRNGERLTDFSLKIRQTYLNTKFQKMEGKQWTYTYSACQLHRTWN